MPRLCWMARSGQTSGRRGEGCRAACISHSPPIARSALSDDGTTACLTINILPVPAPSSATDSAGNLAWQSARPHPVPGRGKQPIVRRISSSAPIGEPVVTRSPAAAKSIVSDRTSSTRRRPDHATRHGLLSVKVEGVSNDLLRGDSPNGQASARTRRVCARGEQKRHRHRIKYGYERQSKQPDRPLKVGGRRTDQLGEISHGADVSLGAPALRVDRGFLDLQAGKCPSLALAYCHDIGTIAAFLVSDRHRTNRGVLAVSIPRRLRQFGRCDDRGRRWFGPGWRDGPRCRRFCPRAPDRRLPYDRGGRA